MGSHFFTLKFLLRATGIQFSSVFRCRANVVIGDVYERGIQNLVEAINKLPSGSGKAFWTRCDVARWDDQVALFELAMTRFGGVDIVVSVPSLQIYIVGGVDL